MVKAELTHNPYLLNTEARFNEQAPRINCQIEKYEKKPLKDWVNEVPGIFYDEMNGYDFDFYFTGTLPDFNEVKAAFETAGVSPKQVRLFHKNEIEDSETKSAEIDALLEWLKQHPNRKFNYDDFMEKNVELFEGTYPYIMIGGDAPEKMTMSISPESIDSALQLINTDLSGTPILFYIDEKKRGKIRTDLTTLMARKDVQQEQLFFMIDPSLNRDQVARVISDLGVTNPQIVDRYDAEEVLCYFRNYPITEYVRNAITVFSELIDQIQDTLSVENKASAITNAGIHAEIEGLEDEIGRLKEADDFFIQRDNYTMPPKFEQNRQELETQLSRWKNRKTKIIGDHEVETAASDYSNYINKAISSFLQSVKSTYILSGHAIDNVFSGAYGNAGIDRVYSPSGIQLYNDVNIQFPELTAEFLEMKEVSFQEAKNDFFGLFKIPSEESGEPVRVVTSYLDQWRTRAAERIMPAADRFIEGCYSNLLTYYNAMANAYHEHLQELMAERNDKKDLVSGQLSDDEKRLQEDNDWLAAVQDQLQNIERG